MSRPTFNEIFKQQQKTLVSATFKRAVISSVNQTQGTVSVYFIENPQTIIKGVAVAASVDLSTVSPGMICRVDAYGENNPNSMVVAYVVGQVYSPYSVINPMPVPSSSSSAGSAGNISWDTNYLYICTAPNTWRRVAISSF